MLGAMDFGIANHGERTGREKAAQVATSLCPRQFPMILHAADSYAAGNNFGSLKRSPRTIMAQAIRAILLASATAPDPRRALWPAACVPR